MTVGELKAQLDKFEDDVEVFMWHDKQEDGGFEIQAVNEDAGRPGEIGCFLESGDTLPLLF